MLYYIEPGGGVRVYGEMNRRSHPIGQIAHATKIKAIPIANNKKWLKTQFRGKTGYIQREYLSRRAIARDLPVMIEKGRVNHLQFSISSDELEYRGQRLIKVWQWGKIFCQKKIRDYLHSYWKNDYIISFHSGFGEGDYSENSWGELDIRKCKKNIHSFAVLSVETFLIDGQQIMLENYENESGQRYTLQMKQGQKTINLVERKKIEVKQASDRVLFRYDGKWYDYRNGRLIAKKNVSKPLSQWQIK